MKKYIGYALSALVSVLALTGCGKNDSSSNPAVYGYGYSNCAGCAGNTQLMTTAVSQNQQIGEALQLQFLTTSAMSYQTAATSGYQQVAAQGTLILGPTAQQYCGIPAGTYQVTSATAPAVMQGNYIQGMQMIATGPTTLQVVIQRIYFTSPTSFQTNGYVVGPTGYQCQIAYY